jgi:glycosyltransferase involved in cell wall biosynthesis
MPGFIPRFSEGSLNGFYERAWVLINTSAREGLPYTFIESCAWHCALLSCLDPDGFTSRFGYHVRTDEQSEFERGMQWLLEGDRWRSLGQAGGEFVAGTFSEEASLSRHLEKYNRLLSADAASSRR